MMRMRWNGIYNGIIWILLIVVCVGCSASCVPSSPPVTRTANFEPIGDRKSLQDCVVQSRCECDGRSIRAAVKEGQLSPTDFVNVWDNASTNGRANLLTATAPWRSITELQQQSRLLWTNGKDRESDDLWLEQFQMFEVPGHVPEVEIAKLRVLLEHWDKDNPLDLDRVQALRNCIMITESASLKALAIRRGFQPSTMETQ